MTRVTITIESPHGNQTFVQEADTRYSIGLLFKAAAGAIEANRDQLTTVTAAMKVLSDAFASLSTSERAA